MMDLKPFQYLYSWAQVQHQEDSAPFIGDALCTEDDDFHEVPDKSVSVVKVDMGEKRITVYLAVEVKTKKIPDKYDSIIVGARTSLPSDRQLKNVVVEWIAVNVNKDVSEVTFEIELEPGPIQINHYIVQEKKDFKPSRPDGSFQFSCFLERINSLVRKICEVAEDLAVTSDQETLEKYHKFSSEMVTAAKDHLKKQLSDVSSDTWIFISYVLFKQHAKIQTLDVMIEEDLGSMKGRYNQKRQLVDMFESKSLAYISSLEKWQETLNEYEQIYVLMFREHLLLSSKKVCEFFFNWSKQQPESFNCVLDLDLVPPESVGGRPPKECVVRQYEQGDCKIEDLQRHMVESKTNVVTHLGEWDPVIPEKRALLRIRCPGHYKNACPGTVRQWQCKICLSHIYYGFNDNIYCDRCGTAPLRDCRFSCQDVDHDGDLPLTKQNGEELLRLVPMPELNILLISQSGVGKSTLVNAVVNYMTFKTLEKAEERDVMAPIPSKFILTDDNLQPKTIYAGNFDDDIEVGQSVTQKCANYSVLYEGKVINFIDSPGLGDSRGVDEDRENIKKILDHIRFIKHLHGICLLLKPNETRISVLLSYCLREILSNLHQSSSNNLLFCFTNARSTFYKPGETMPLLIKLLQDIGVNMPMKDRTFCLDNEAFKYLCCRNTPGITFSASEHDSFSQSWEKSVEETTRLLDRVSMLEPHKTADTWSLNRARRIILSLTRPIADITMIIEDNMNQYELKKAELESSRQNMGQLKQYAIVTQLTLVAKELGYPRTVCTAEKCVKYHTFPKTKERKTQYVTHCHPHCYLTGVTAEQYPNRDLLNCAAMGGTQQCRQCYCSWQHHMHILYDQTVEEIDVHDQQIEETIRNATDETTAKAGVLRRLEEQRQEHENEKLAIIRQCVKFAHFLRNNAIAGYNDALGDYLRFLIEKEEAKKNKTPMEVEKIDKMKETRKQYEEEVLIFGDAAKEGRRNITPEDIAEAERELYSLPIYGKKLKDVMAVALAAEDNASRYSGAVTTVHKGKAKTAPKPQPSTSGWKNNNNAKKGGKNEPKVKSKSFISYLKDQLFQ